MIFTLLVVFISLVLKPLQSLYLQPCRSINKNLNKDFKERDRERGKTIEREMENERREIEVGDSPESSIEGWVALERDRKRKDKAMHKLRKRSELFFTFGRLVRQMSFIYLKTGEIKTEGEPLPKKEIPMCLYHHNMQAVRVSLNCGVKSIHTNVCKIM